MQIGQAQARIGNAVIGAVFDIGQEMIDDDGRDKVARVFESMRAFECHADHLVVLDDGTAAVAGIDRSIGLNGEKGAIADMHIALDLDARDHAPGIRDLLATGRKAVSNHGRSDFGKRTKLEGLHALVEFRIVLPRRRIDHPDDREVNIVRDEFDLGEVTLRIVVLPNQQLLGEGHDMRVGHDTVAINEKTGA